MEIISEKQVQARLSELDIAWTAIGNDYLVRAFQTSDFDDGVDLVNKVAKLAKKQAHHPDVMLTYNRVELRLSTHSVAGITEADFDLAKAIDHQFTSK